MLLPEVSLETGFLDTNVTIFSESVISEVHQL